MLQKISIFSRLVLLLIFSAVLLVAATILMYVETKKIAAFGTEQATGIMFDGQKERIRDLATTMAASLGELIKGVQDPAERQQIIAKAILHARYEHDKSGYFFVYDGGLVVAHVKQDLVGKDLGGAVDANGVRFNAELARKAAAGGGFVEFIFEKPGAGKQPKIAYGAAIPGTTLWVGAGIYIDNIDVIRTRITSEMETLINDSTLYVLAFLGVILVLVYLPIVVWIARSITQPLKDAVHVADKVADGHFEARWASDSRDELGRLGHSLNVAFDKVAHQMFWFRNILDAIPLNLSVTDMDSRWTFLNKVGADKLGLKSMESVLGHPCADKKTPVCGTDRCARELMKRGVEESQWTDTDGKVYKTRFERLQDQEGKQTGYVEITQDITHEYMLQQEAEESLKRGRQETVAALEKIVEGISSVSTELASYLGQAEKGSMDQAARITQTAAAMEEMNSTVMEVARNADMASQVSGQTKDKANTGASVVQKALKSIRVVRQESLTLKEDMAALQEHAQAISQIMGVISDIADQTNLLALNAAIEAARAGEAGRGFAVVADEVRKLAEKTMASTTDVAKAITSIQASSDKSVEQVDRAVQAVEEATEFASQSGGALEEIVSMADNTADQVRAIATASEEQSASSEEISRSVHQVNTLAGETAQSMQAASKAVNSLTEQSQVLTGVIRQMKAQ